MNDRSRSQLYYLTGLAEGAHASALSNLLRSVDGISDVQVDIGVNGISTATVYGAGARDTAAIRRALIAAGFEMLASA